MLIVETGQGTEFADSYLTEVDAQVLAIKYGIEFPIDVDAAEVALRQGYLNLNTNEQMLQGYRSYEIQTGIFPRSDVYANNYLVASDAVPEDIKLAQLYAASAISGGVDVNATNDGQNLKSFNVDGVYSEEYQDGSRIKVNSRIQGVYNSLYPYSKQAIGLNGRSFRAHEDIY